jgi:hypothetical protein
LGYCCHRQSRAFTPQHLTPIFLADVRAYLRSLKVSPGQWLDFITDAYRDGPLIVNERGEEVDLDLDQFETVSRYWWRDQTKPLRTDVTPRVRAEAVERLLVISSILRARDPSGTALWGMRPANDNRAVH